MDHVRCLRGGISGLLRRRLLAACRVEAHGDAAELPEGSKGVELGRYELERHGQRAHLTQAADPIWPRSHLQEVADWLRCPFGRIQVTEKICRKALTLLQSLENCRLLPLKCLQSLLQLAALLELSRYTLSKDPARILHVLVFLLVRLHKTLEAGPKFFQLGCRMSSQTSGSGQGAGALVLPRLQVHMLGICRTPSAALRYAAGIGCSHNGHVGLAQC
mmetsp:Transcript_71607/g.155590  ORF Transcript_71607/g.155590 Transcript_71607/m.155590 type:complete len:218 (-) Transcript_71607:239-892(-)